MENKIKVTKTVTITVDELQELLQEHFGLPWADVFYNLERYFVDSSGDWRDGGDWLYRLKDVTITKTED